MASSWGLSWGLSWGNSWGQVGDTPTPPPKPQGGGWFDRPKDGPRKKRKLLEKLNPLDPMDAAILAAGAGLL